MTNFLQVTDNAYTRASSNQLNNLTSPLTLTAIDTSKFDAVTTGYALTIYDDKTYQFPVDDPNMEKVLVTAAIIGLAGSLTFTRPNPKLHIGTPIMFLGVLAQHINNVTSAINANETNIANNTTTIAGKYTKPGTGIPITDLTTTIQTSLGKADTALQTAPVTSVNTKTGAVSLTTTDVAEGANQYFTNARSSAAAPVQSVAGRMGAVTLAETDITNLVADLAATEKAANKGIANGYVPLGSDSKIASSYLPSYVDDVIEYSTLSALPATGETGKIYITQDTNFEYRWSGSVYIRLVSSPGSTDALAEGTNNLYFTSARASAAAPVQSVAGRNGVVALTKTDVGLTNVDNTSDANKPISNAEATALAGKKSTILNGGTKTANFTAAPGTITLVDASAGNVTVTFPTSVAGQEFQIKKIDAKVPVGSTTGIVILSGNINGNANASIQLRKINQGKQAVSDGNGGWLIALGDIDITSLYADGNEPGTVQLAGDLTGTATSPALIPTGTAGTYGSASAIPVITTDSKGRVTAVTTASLATMTPADATTTSKGIVQLAGDLGGTAASPTTPTAVHIIGTETITGAKTFSQNSFYDNGNYVYDARIYGVIADGVQLLDGVINSSSTTFTSATANFTSADVNKQITIVGAAAGGGILDATIQSITTTTSIIISTAAGTSVTTARTYYGTNNSAFVSAGVLAIKNSKYGGILQLPAGIILEKTNWTSGASLTSNMWIRGQGRGTTQLVSAGNISLIGLGDFNANNNNIIKNLCISDMTLDMLPRTSGFAQGINLGSAQDVTIENIHIRGGAGGSGYQLAFGINAGGGSYQFTRNILVSNCLFSDGAQTNEGVSLLQSNYVKFVNCTFRNKSSTYSVLNYNSYNVSFVGCNFYGDSASGCKGAGVNGFGGTLFTGCNFFGTGISIYGRKVGIDNCIFHSYGTLTSTLANTNSNATPFIGNAAIFIGASQNGTSEVGWDGGDIGVVQKSGNIHITNTVIDWADQGIIASYFQDKDLQYSSSLTDITMQNVTISNTGHRGIELVSDRVTLRDVTVYNSNRLNLGTERHNISINSREMRLYNVRSYNENGYTNVNKDLLFDRQATSLVVYPQMSVYLEDNTFEAGGFQVFDGGFTTTIPNSITIFRTNNIGDLSSTYSLHNLGGGFKLQSLTTPLAPTVNPVSIIKDAVVTNGSTTMTSATANFTSADTGISISGRYIPSGTTITYVNATTVTLSSAATGSDNLQRIVLNRTGTTSYTYYIVAEDRAGNQTLQSAATTINNGLTALNSIDTNSLSWTVVQGAVKYHILKNNLTSRIGTVFNTVNYIDTGTATSSFTITSRNATADMQVDGKLTVLADPTLSLEVATKQYVDSSITSAGSGYGRSVSTVSNAITAGSATRTDYVYNVTATCTITLPTAVGNTNRYTITNVAIATTTTVATTNNQTINGSITAPFSGQYYSNDYVSDGANWFIR